MIRTALTFVFLSALAIGAGCGTNKTSGNSPTVSKLDLEHINDKTQIDPPNELGNSKITIRYGDEYKEGVLDAQQKEVIAPSKEYLVQDITGDMALLQLERKFRFVPLADGPYRSLSSPEENNEANTMLLLSVFSEVVRIRLLCSTVIGTLS